MAEIQVPHITVRYKLQLYIYVRLAEHKIRQSQDTFTEFLYRKQFVSNVETLIFSYRNKKFQTEKLVETLAIPIFRQHIG